MSPNYLTDLDVQNYGHELIDFSQRAAAQAVAPQLQALSQQNAQLAQQVAIERRKRLASFSPTATPISM